MSLFLSICRLKSARYFCYRKIDMFSLRSNSIWYEFSLLRQHIEPSGISSAKHISRIRKNSYRRFHLRWNHYTPINKKRQYLILFKNAEFRRQNTELLVFNNIFPLKTKKLKKYKIFNENMRSQYIFSTANCQKDLKVLDIWRKWTKTVLSTAKFIFVKNKQRSTGFDDLLTVIYCIYN